MSDPVEEVFSDLTYPGSRQKRGTKPNAPALVDGWDRSPVRKRVGGQEREFFLIGALAEALGKKAVTIRLWERNGWIPGAVFRTPRRGTREGRRLYTREQVEGLVQLAREEGLLDVARLKSFADSEFPNRAAELFQRLREAEA